jgi:NCAIR mutase (PurE)-related protein
MGSLDRHQAVGKSAEVYLRQSIGPLSKSSRSTLGTHQPIQTTQTPREYQSPQDRKDRDTADNSYGELQLLCRHFNHSGRHLTLAHMKPEEVEELLSSVAAGVVTVDEAVGRLRYLPVADIDFARLDVHRELRQGFPEVVYAESKTPAQTVAIVTHMLENTTAPVLATRVPEATADALTEAFRDADYNSLARTVVLRSEETGLLGLVTIVSAGTSDLPVAEEAAVVLRAYGAKVERLPDAGVAGLHRILESQDSLNSADIVICVAGMEGALPSIVGGITSTPVVAVPTSVGYGAAFQGLAALLGMLNSCAAGIVVTNIDNGFGAAMFALRLLRKGREP